MKKIFWGLLFICFDWSLSQLSKSLPAFDLLPDFIGYALILRGIPELNQESGTLDRLRIPLIAFIVFSVVEWVASAILGEAVSVLQLMLILCLGLVDTILCLYTLYKSAKGYQELESVREHGEKMEKYWKWIPYLVVITYLLTGSMSIFSAVGSAVAYLIKLLIFVALVIAMYVLHILYLVQAYQAAKNYVPGQPIVSIQWPDDPARP